MKFIYLLLVIVLFANSLCSKENILYPVYSIKYDKVNNYYIDIIKIQEEVFPISKGFPPIEKTFYMFNLNNLLLLEDLNDRDSNFYLLGQIIIEDNNKLKYKYYEVTLDEGFHERNQKIVTKKRLDIKKSISYINDGNFSLEEIKKLLDVDLIEANYGKELFEKKQVQISVKEAMSHFINCRFCEQMIEIFSSIHGCFQYSICNNIETYAILFNKEYFERGYLGSSKSLIEFFENINSNGNIYKQLNKKYIAKTYEEWNCKVKENKGE